MHIILRLETKFILLLSEIKLRREYVLEKIQLLVVAIFDDINTVPLYVYNIQDFPGWRLCRIELKLIVRINIIDFYFMYYLKK